MEYNYGGFWRRSVAFLVDNIILSFIATLLFIIGIAALWLSFSFTLSGSTWGRITGLTVSFFILYHLVLGIVGMLYFTYFHGTVGQTPGKMILGLKVIQADGKAMNLGIAFLRWVGYAVSSLVFYLGFIWIAFDKRKRGWHDRIAGTIVIRVNDLVRDASPLPMIREDGGKCPE